METIALVAAFIFVPAVIYSVLRYENQHRVVRYYTPLPTHNRYSCK